MDNQMLYQQIELIEKNSGAIEDTIQSMKQTIYRLIDENSSLKIENTHLRERLEVLSDMEASMNKKTAKHALSNLEKLYDSGVHICHNFYGATRSEACLLCESLFSQMAE